MIQCQVCMTVNADDAHVCTKCHGPLNGSKGASTTRSGNETARRSETLVESATFRSARCETIDESIGSISEPRAMSPEPRAATPDARRMTVFAGMQEPGQTSWHDPGLQGRAFADNSGLKPAASVRKIVGVLVTFSWSDQGQIFPVLEGRNRIGRDPGQCDIVISQDETLSAVNSHIVFRKNFVIGDDVSMGGTDVDGEPVESEFVPLRNYARIRTGSTHWTFVALQPPNDQLRSGSERKE